MNRELTLHQSFGTFLAEGARAAEYRLREIEPFIHVYELVILDFTGVRNINSSFANALVVPLIEQHGAEALEKIRFRGCNPIVRIMIEAAINLGVEKAREQGQTLSV